MVTPTISPREPLYKNPYQEIYRVKADFGAYAKEYYVTDTGERAGMVAIRDHNVMLVQQYRLLVNGLSWEIPGGKVDEGEVPAEAAARECLEETGVRCLHAKPLVFYHVGMDTSYNPTHLFYCDEVSETSEPHHIDPKEVSGYEWVPLSRCMEMIFKGEIVDSLTIISLLAYQTMLTKP